MDKYFGSSWNSWDMQAQTILDDTYVELKEYYRDIKERTPDLWDEYIKIICTSLDLI